MKITILPILVVLISSGHGASVVELSNPVTDGAINTTGGNNDRSDWSSTIAFPTDPDEANAVDYSAITVAHDSTNFYLRQQLYRNDASGFISGTQVIMLDTDQSRATGYRGANDTFAVGAEYMLQGFTLYAYTGTGIDWGWSPVVSAVYDDFPINDHELSFARSDIGSPTGFDFIAITDYFGAGDAYVDGAQNGSTGNWLTYNTVPEPDASFLIAAAGLLSVYRRRRSSSTRHSATAGSLARCPGVRYQTSSEQEH